MRGRLLVLLVLNVLIVCNCRYAIAFQSNRSFTTTPKLSSVSSSCCCGWKAQPHPHRELYSFASRTNSRLALSSVEDDQEDDDSYDIAPILIFGGIPLLSLGLVILLQFKLMSSLLIAKRLYVYALATTVVLVASWRGASDAAGLGTRLIDLTREILPDYQSQDSKRQQPDDQRFQEMAVLDQVDDSTQAVGLPLLVVSSLVASLLFVLIQQTDFSETSAAIIDIPFLESLQSALPILVSVSNGLVLSLFARAELKRLSFLNDDTREAAATASALMLSALAFLGPAALVWPIQNCLCACLAIAVARAIQLPRLGPILLALSGLVLYDVASVGIQLVNLGSETLASTHQQAGSAATSAAATAAAASASSSAMGAVALSKVGGGGGDVSSLWQPGLFVVRLRGIVTDLLGLGDAVFPTLLANFCLRFDQEQATREESSSTFCFAASLVGFATGCLACEFVPGISGSGLPALLFIIPSMLALVGLSVALQGNLGSFWAFDAAANEDDIQEK